MKRISRSLFTSPLPWGVLAAIGFYSLVEGGVLTSPLFPRYFAGHQVSYAMTVMFFVGMACLAWKAADVFAQLRRLRADYLGPIPASRQPIETCTDLLRQLDERSANAPDDYRVGRLRAALEHTRHKGSAAGLDEELKYLADQDAGRAYADYGLVRTIAWSIPILGFLGTVIGIAVALGNLEPEALAESMDTVRSGLAVAFDTTTLALALSIVLVFTQFFIDRQETRLLAEVDRRVDAELLGRFEQFDNQASGDLAAVRHMLQSVVTATERLVERQAGLWRQSMEEANQRFLQIGAQSARQVEAGLGRAIADGLQTHAHELARAEARFVDHQHQQWRDWEATVAPQVELLQNLEQGVTQQTELLRRVIDATGQVATLEERLNQNLQTLSGAAHFEETVNSLAAAIHLLTGRLPGQPQGERPVQLGAKAKNKGTAA